MIISKKRLDEIVREKIEREQTQSRIANLEEMTKSINDSVSELIQDLMSRVSVLEAKADALLNEEQDGSDGKKPMGFTC